MFGASTALYYLQLLGNE